MINAIRFRVFKLNVVAPKKNLTDLVKRILYFCAFLSADQYFKTFLVKFYALEKKARVFGTVRHFKPSLILANKAEAYWKSAPCLGYSRILE
jgi:hypothetical protein